MNSARVIITKCIGLAYRQLMLGDSGPDNGDLIKEVFSSMMESDKGLRMDVSKELMGDVFDLIKELLTLPESSIMTLSELNTNIRNICMEEPDMSDMIEDMLEGSEDVKEAKFTSINLSRSLNTFIKDKQVVDILGKISYKINFDQTNQLSATEIVEEAIPSLEELVLDTDKEDPAVVAMVNLDDSEGMESILEAAQEKVTGATILKTGDQGFNKMTQGGIRLGEFVFISALQHNYKTGFTMNLFGSIPNNNTPVERIEGKQPAMVRISFEDPIESNILFAYQDIVHNKTGKKVDIENTSIETMRKTIQAHFTKSGWKVMMVRINPSEWTYRDMFQFILRLDAEGYDVQSLWLDYLAMMPTTHCNITGPMGTDLRDLLRRTRNFGSARDMAVITPHQLSTTAKSLLSGEVEAKDFLDTIKGLGMYSGSRQLDQEVDVNIYVHKVKEGDDYYLNVLLDKHRLPTYVEERYKSYFIKFPKNGMPIASDMNKKKASTRSLPRSISEIDLF